MRPISFLWNDHVADFVTQISWSPSGELLAAISAGGELGVFTAAKGESLFYKKIAHEGGADGVAWHSEGAILATCGQDGMGKLWDVPGKKLIKELPGGTAWVERLGWGQRKNGDTLLALGAGNRVTLWDKTGEKQGEIPFPKVLCDLAWIQGGKTLAVATSTLVALFEDPESMKSSRTYTAKSPILNMAFSPNGRWLMTGTQDRAVHVWSCETGEEMHMSGYPDKPRRYSWHKAGRWFATNGAQTAALVWDCAGKGPSGRPPTMLEWHTDVVSDVNYQAKGDLLVSGAKDGSVAIWNPTERRPLVGGAKIESEVTQALWSPSGDCIAVSGAEGDIQVLSLGK